MLQLHINICGVCSRRRAAVGPGGAHGGGERAPRRRHAAARVPAAAQPRRHTLARARRPRAPRTRRRARAPRAAPVAPAATAAPAQEAQAYAQASALDGARWTPPGATGRVGRRAAATQSASDAAGRNRGRVGRHRTR